MAVLYSNNFDAEPNGALTGWTTANGPGLFVITNAAATSGANGSHHPAANTTVIKRLRSLLRYLRERFGKIQLQKLIAPLLRLSFVTKEKFQR
jgi:hypothetical protein